MLSDSLREARRQALHCARGGIVMTADEMIGFAARLAAWESEAANLEAIAARVISDARLAAILAGRPRFGRRYRLNAGGQAR